VDRAAGLFAAVQRQDLHGEPATGWYPEERVDATAALHGFTTGPAQAAGLAGRAGVLAPGAFGDVVAWDRDPLACEPGGLLDLRAAATIVGGEAGPLLNRHLRGEGLRTRIVCTVGPATAAEDKVHALAELGVDVVRLNFAHGNHDTHRQVIQWVRAASAACGRPMAVLADLAGPKIRIGALKEPVRLTEKHRVTIAPEGEQSEGELPSTSGWRRPPRRPHLLDDGNMGRGAAGGGRARRPQRGRGGLVRGAQGLNLPGVRVSAPALGQGHRGPASRSWQTSITWDSFVQSAADARPAPASCGPC
jgi:hypothetical protein